MVDDCRATQTAEWTVLHVAGHVSKSTTQVSVTGLKSLLSALC